MMAGEGSVPKELESADTRETKTMPGDQHANTVMPDDHARANHECILEI